MTILIPINIYELILHILHRKAFNLLTSHVNEDPAAFDENTVTSVGHCAEAGPAQAQPEVVVPGSPMNVLCDTIHGLDAVHGSR